MTDHTSGKVLTFDYTSIYSNNEEHSLKDCRSTTNRKKYNVPKTS